MNAIFTWGKCERGTGLQHHLAHHCADVAACFAELARSAVIVSRLDKATGGNLSPTILDRLAVIVFLHDAGKLLPGFQAKGWPEGFWKRPLAGRVREGAALLTAGGRIAENLQVGELIRWQTDVGVLFAALAHHGRPFHQNDIPDLPESQVSGVTAGSIHYDPVAASVEMGAMIRAWFPQAFTPDAAPLPATPAFQHLFCGLVSLADWVGSDARIFEFVAALDPDYMQLAQERARRAIAALHLDPLALRALISGHTDFSTIAGFADPRPQQRMVGECPLGEQLVILEAETGSGKTEAALWRFAQLFEAGQVDSLYFALPTRAAAIQLHGRVTKVMTRLFGARAPEPVLAVPGYLRMGEAEGTALPNWQVRWSDASDVDEERLLARWAAENAKRYLAAPVAVGTVDQAMLAGLQVKHAHLRAASLSRSFLVIDEVHASDAYMTGVLSHLLKMHLGYGGHAMLMSATLGATARARWLGRPEPAFDDAAATPYPAVWTRNTPAPSSAPQDGHQKRVAISLVATMAAEELAERSTAAARAGARVLAIRNTVEAAVASWEAVRAAGAEDLLLGVAGGPALHHGRFAPEDRKQLDRAVERALSPRDRGPGGVIVIGTQTLEQSLDIDADILLTDLCPVDVLLQRIGRLHRHKLDRPPGFEAPQCLVMTPEKGLAPLLKPCFENGLGGWIDNGVLEGIYRDLSILELTRRLIADHPVWTIPAMNRRMVESAVHPDRIEALHAELGEEWAYYWRKVYGKDIADLSAAHLVTLPIHEPFGGFAFPSDEEKIRTRLGAEGAVITFAEPLPIGPFGEPVSSLTLPSHWSHGLDTREPVTPTRGENGLAFQLGERRFTYDRRGLTRTNA